MIKEIKQRWKAESPDFWKKVKHFAVTLGTSAVAVLASDKLFDLQTYGVPQLVFTIAGYVIVACATLGLSAQITKKDVDTN
jgi:hypothetical protein